MSIELAATIIAGVSSSLNLIATVVGLCMQGTFRSECCGAKIEHDDQSRESSRSSSPAPISMQVE